MHIWILSSSRLLNRNWSTLWRIPMKSLVITHTLLVTSSCWVIICSCHGTHPLLWLLKYCWRNNRCSLAAYEVWFLTWFVGGSESSRSFSSLQPLGIAAWFSSSWSTSAFRGVPGPREVMENDAALDSASHHISRLVQGGSQAPPPVSHNPKCFFSATCL